MNINFEDEIEKILNEDIIIPDSVLEKKEIAFNQIRKNKKVKFSYRKNIAVAVMTISIIGGVLFGNSAIAAIKNCIFGYAHGVQKAVDNGYIQNIDDNIMKDNGVEIKVNNILKDSKRIALSLNLKFDDKNLMKNFKCMKISSSISTDTGVTVPVSFSDYDFNLDEETGELIFNEVKTLQEVNYANGNTVLENDLKNTSSLNLKIKKIELYTDASSQIDLGILPQLDNDTKNQLEEAGVKLYKEIDGTWETNIKLDEKFKDVKPIKYKVSENNNFINIVSAELLPTGMDITFNYNNQTKPLTKEIQKEIGNIILVDDKGITYKPTEGVSQKYSDDDKTNITKTFCVTSFDKIGDIKMIIKDLNGNMQEIKLVKAC